MLDQKLKNNQVSAATTNQTMKKFINGGIYIFNKKKIEHNFFNKDMSTEWHTSGTLKYQPRKHKDIPPLTNNPPRPKNYY